MTTLAPPPAVTSYANAVRDHLAGLDAETLDELTGGLEADLAEALAERDPDGGATDLAGVTAVFGSPRAYAEELRTAAGVELPAAGPEGSRSRLRDVLRRAHADALATWATLRQRHGWLRWSADFLGSLRPAWWLLRGWVLFHLFTGMWSPVFGAGLDRVLLLALVLVSVLWGQRRVGQHRWWRRLGLAATAVAIVATLPVMIGMYQRVVWHGSPTSGYEQGYSDGQMAAAQTGGIAGAPSNLFVYGPDGQPIENAQIVDQDGNPVVLSDARTGGTWAEWDDWAWSGEAVPAPVLDGAALNVYPWSYLGPEHLTIGDDGGVVGRTTYADDPRWPAATLFPVISDEATDEASEPVPSDAATPGGTSGTDETTDAPAGATDLDAAEGATGTGSADQPEVDPAG